MLFHVVIALYSVSNLLLALIVFHKSQHNTISKFYGFCVGSLIFMGIAALLMNQPFINSLHGVLDRIILFLYSVFPFFFLHFVVLFVRRHNILNSRFVIPAVYFTGLFSYTVVLLGYIGGPITATGEITQSGYTFFLTWNSIFFSIGIAMLYEVARGFYDRPGRANMLFVCFVLLMLVLPSPFTESLFFNILHFDSRAYYFSCIIALTIAVYYIFRHKIIVNTLFDALKAMLSAANDVFISMDDSFRIEMARGTSVASLLGFEEQDLVGRNFTDFIGHADFVREYKSFVLKGKMKAYYLDTKVFCKDMRTVMMNFSIAPLFVENQLVGFVSIGRDITERLQAESKLRLQSAALEAAANGIVITDREGVIQWVNPAFTKLTGYAADEAIGKKPSILKSDKHDDTFFKKLWDTILSGETWNHQIINRRKDGTLYTEEQTITPVKNDTGEIVNFIAIKHDISERQRAEEKLRRSEERFHNLYDNSAIGLYRTTPDGQILMANPALVRMLGYDSFEELAKIDLSKSGYVDSAKRNEFKKILEESDGVTGYEAAWRRKDGRVIFVSEGSKAIRDKAGKIVYYDGTVEDVTERKRAEAALQESERRFRQLVEHIHDALITDDAAGNVTFANNQFLALFGFKREQLPHLKLEDYIAPEWWQQSRERHDRRVGGEMVPAHFECEGIRQDGKRLWLEVDVVSLLDGAGRVTGTQSAIRDITQRKLAESKLRASEQRYQTLVNVSPVGVFQTDAQGTTTYVNSGWCEIAGMLADQALDNGWLRAVHPDDLASLSAGWKKAAGAKEISRAEYRFLRPDGSIKWVVGQANPEKDDTGRVVGFVGTITDITERKHAEEQLRLSEEQFRLITENASDLIAVIDREGRRVYNSPSYEAILGDRASLRGLDSFMEIHPDDREKVKTIFSETVRTGVSKSAEFRLISKDGNIHFLESRGNAIRDKNGNVSQVVVVSRDVTEKKALEQQILRAQRMESIGTLAGGIAHDLNNVLSPIMLSLEILRRKLPDEQSQKMLQILESTTKRGSDLIRQVLSFARGVGGERATVHVRHLIDDIGKIINETFPKSISFQSEISKTLPTISADPTQLHQVLMNLCVNARDAMPRGGTIRVKAESFMVDKQYARMHVDAKPGLHVLITLTDQGKGIPPAILERIFEPFFTTKEIGRGTGLGLSTVLAIVKSHGGFINVYSEVGKGTTFKVYFPAQEGTHAAAEEEQEKPPVGNGELILVVDDELSIREFTKATLETYGYTVMIAADGIEAVSTYATHGNKVALVVTDMMMPNMDGTMTIRALQKINPKVKVLAVSGLIQNEDAFNHESVMFLPKPYTSELLLQTIDKMLRRK